MRNGSNFCVIASCVDLRLPTRFRIRRELLIQVLKRPRDILHVFAEQSRTDAKTLLQVSERLIGCSSTLRFIGLSCRRGIQTDGIGCERLTRRSRIVFQAPNEDKSKRHEHHRQPEPEKDFEKDASHGSALICFEWVNVPDSPDGLDPLFAVGSRPELLAKVAYVNVEASVERRKLASEHFFG